MNRKFHSFFKTVGGNEGQKCLYPTRLDTYGCGCQHDCKYCYAKSLLQYRGFWNPNEPAIADINEIEKVICTKLKKGDVVRLGGMTDCFMPLELNKKVTYNTIKLLNKYCVHYLIVTKPHFVANDEYLNIYDRKLAHIQVTYTCTNDDWSRHFEKASLPSQRVKAIEMLQQNGFDVAVRLSPFIPQCIDYNILNNIKCKKILVEFLRANLWIKKWFKINYEDWTIYQNGYWHLPLSKKINYLSNIKSFEEMSVCEDENEAYAYWKNFFNKNSNDCCNLRM